MSGDKLFPDLPEQRRAEALDAGKPRQREPVRDQVELRAVDLEALMLEQIKQRHGRWPKRCLVDGGFNKNEDTEWATNQGIKIYGPPSSSKHDRDPYAPCASDTPGVAAWRARMKSPHGKSIYKRRARAECLNARFRNWGLYQFTVRSLEKVATVLRWFALTNNILAGHRLLQNQV